MGNKPDKPVTEYGVLDRKTQLKVNLSAVQEEIQQEQTRLEKKYLDYKDEISQLIQILRQARHAEMILTGSGSLSDPSLQLSPRTLGRVHELIATIQRDNTPLWMELKSLLSSVIEERNLLQESQENMDELQLN
eukprot:TRINITY_DN4199_c0_g1_i1.p1 TRINITY_DN4199_c0_g1~~TRINITY_DN4199_c0_g1_i1.p1  ORF type:complete len:134 (-),score=27.33 TRINITY_DN4199_c0_g1_i1:193-594(-)